MSKSILSEFLRGLGPESRPDLPKNADLTSDAFVPLGEDNEIPIKGFGPMTRIEQKSIRAKTRFLNFRFTEKPEVDDQIVDDMCDFEQPEGQNPIGWLVIVEGAGRGESFSLLSDVVHIGRDDGQEVQLAFGDLSVSRRSHATIIYYGERAGFLILDGRKANPVLLNGRALKEDGCLNHGDLIRIGETTLRFMSHCKV